MVPMDPMGSCRIIVVLHSTPRSGSKPLKTCQDHARPYASPVGVVEDRSVLMGLPDGSHGPNGSCGTIVVKHSPPRSGSRPLKTRQDHACPYASPVGVVED